MELKRKIKLSKDIVKNKGIKGAVNLYRNYSLLKNEPLKLKSRPLIVKMEPTINCNLKCIMCDRTYWDRESDDMTFEGFKKALDDMPYVATINLQGLGEPLLNRDLFKMIEYAKKKGVEIGFFTNATILNENISEKLIKSGVDYINMSLDAATPENYEKIRVNAKYDIVIRNMKNFIKKRNEMKSKKPKISVWTVIFDANYDEIPGLVRLAKEIGVDEYVMQSAHSWGKDYMKDHTKREKIDEHKEKTTKLMKEAKKIADEIDLNFGFTTMYPDEQHTRKCKAPWLTTYISADGFVTPCCMQASDPRLINFGNIHEESFSKIWNNEKYQAFRKEMKEGMPKVCEGCPGYFYESN